MQILNVDATKKMSDSAKWLRKKRKELIKRFGGKCKICGTKRGLEFAHTKPTDLKGAGRGSYNRYKDVVDHPKSYRLLCHKHNIEEIAKRKRKK